MPKILERIVKVVTVSELDKVVDILVGNRDRLPLRREAPQILFLDRVMDIPVDARGWCAQCRLCRKPSNPAVVDLLVIMQLLFRSSSRT